MGCLASALPGGAGPFPDRQTETALRPLITARYRDLRALLRSDRDVANRADAGAVRFEPADGEIEFALAFEDLGNRLPADGRLHDRLDVAGVQAIARDLLANRRDADARLAEG